MTRPRPTHGIAGDAEATQLPPWARATGQVLPFPAPSRAAIRADSLPTGWMESVGDHADPSVQEACDAQRDLATGLTCRDERAAFSKLVGSLELAQHPVHRWYPYKEAYSPRLPLEILGRLGAGQARVVADPFAGVATTALSLQHHPLVDRVVGVEYSPFAHFVGRAKLRWSHLTPERVVDHIRRLRNFTVDPSLPVPELTAFSNEDIFDPGAVSALLSARVGIEADPRLTAAERDFFLLGLAAIVEDASKAMKDGRALRILHGRSRRRKALTPRDGAVSTGGIQALLVNQWLAMAEDLRVLAPMKARARGRRDLHLKGDARDLAAVDRRGHRHHPLSAESVGLCAYSPPYLNCIDYTEVYKLELWLLGFVGDSTEFRNIRLGTLRSHPSVRFAQQAVLANVQADVVGVVDRIARVLDEQLPRPGLGEMAGNYFEDMYRVLAEQHRILEPGGHAVCVVANSTFARRERVDGEYRETWRLPVLTDVLIGRLAEAAGFAHVELWEARDLRPRNVRSGAARESLVVARKA